MTTPCKNCMDRHQNCHSECCNYNEWRKQLTKEKEKITKLRIANAQADRRRNDAIAKMKMKNHER